MKVQDIFRQARTIRRISQQVVADAVGVEKQSISDSEKLDKTRLSTKTGLYVKLCEMYGLDKESIRQQLEAQKFEERMSKNAMVNK
jgi:DNA-binding XRE family transcriptional regulator